MIKLSYVTDRLTNLMALKENHITQVQATNWRNKANAKEATSPDKNDFRTQIWATIKYQKDADLLSAQPEWLFIWMDDKWRANRKVAKYVWDYHRLLSNTDEAISETIQSSTTNWTGILFDWIKHIRQTVKTPFYTEDKDWNPTWIDFKEEEKLIYSWVYSECIPFQNFFINWTNIRNSTEVAVIRYFDKIDYIKEKEWDNFVKNLDKVKKMTWDFAPIAWTTGNEFEEMQSDNTVMEIEYWNSAKDEYIIEANWVEIKNIPIPYPHKMLPFSLYLDNKAQERIWWIGEFELTEQNERYKNELRTLLIRWIKSSIWILLKDRTAELEEDVMQFWIWEVYETDDINWIKQFSPNVPVNELLLAESKVDEDLVAQTWVDHRSQTLSPWETATKTAGKNKSAKKRINKNIKDNAWGFYRRLAEIRMSNIQFLHSIWSQEIPIEGWSIDAEWVFTSDSWWYGSAKITKKLLGGQIHVLPIVETMLWNSKERELQEALEYAQVVWSMQNSDWSRPVPATQLAKLVTDKFGFDYEKLSEQSDSWKTAKSILQDHKQQTAWTQWTEADPNFVPPAQRNQSQNVSTISWAQKNTIPLE